MIAVLREAQKVVLIGMAGLIEGIGLLVDVVHAHATIAAVLLIEPDWFAVLDQ